MVEGELDKERISKIGELISNQEFDKINPEDFKKIEKKIQGKRNTSNLIKENIKPFLVIITIIEFLILIVIPDKFHIIYFGLIPLVNSFIIGLFLFSISGYGHIKTEHKLFCLFPPVLILVLSFVFDISTYSFNSSDYLDYILWALIYFVYAMFAFIFFISWADKLIGILLSRSNEIKFNKENTSVLHYTTNPNNEIMPYIIYMLFNFFNIREFDENISEKVTSFVFTSNDFELNNPPIYNKLIRYYLFMYHDEQNAKLTFSFFKKYFDRLLIDDYAIENKNLLEYYLLNVCKDLEQSTLDDFEEINQSFINFDNELIGKRLTTNIKKIDWLFDKYVIIVSVAAIFLIIIYYDWSNIMNFVTSHEQMVAAVITVLGGVILFFVNYNPLKKKH